MNETKLTDAELASLEEMAAHYASGNALPFADDTYRESACNATPALVAEVRKLRVDYECEHQSLVYHEQMVARLMARVEALEWFVECYGVCQWVNRGGWYRNAIREARATLEAAREALEES